MSSLRMVLYFEFSAWNETFESFYDWLNLDGRRDAIITGVHHAPISFSEIDARRGASRPSTPGYLTELGLSGQD